MHDDLALLQQGGSVKRQRAAELGLARLKKAALATALLGLLIAAIFSTRQKTPQPLDPLTTGKNVGGYPPTTMRGTRNLEAWNHYKLGWLAALGMAGLQMVDFIAWNPHGILLSLTRVLLLFWPMAVMIAGVMIARKTC